MSTLAPAQFRKIASIALDRWGLNLQAKKSAMVSSRLTKYLKKSSFKDAGDYLSYLEQSDDETEWVALFDIPSTNVTSFFREKRHFDYLEREFYTPLARGKITLPERKIRLWSAGCSAGQEPYSMAIQAFELLPNIDRWDFKILATDLSTSALNEARTAIYSLSKSEQLSPQMLHKYAFVARARKVNLSK